MEEVLTEASTIRCFEGIELLSDRILDQIRS